MPAQLKSFDFRFIVRELRESLLGGKFRKVYQYGPGQKSFLFDIYVSTKGNFWLYSDSEKLFLAQHKKQAPDTPPNFCMFLRKHLMGATIKDIRQHGFDRIVEIVTDNSTLIFEFVPPGNVILCDRFMNIIMPLQMQRWKDRDVLPKRPYVYPHSGDNPYNVSLETFIGRVRDSEGGISSVIAKLGFGNIYANEICTLSEVDPKKACGSLSDGEISEVFETIRRLGSAKPQPVTYDDGSVFPFPLTTKDGGIKGKWSSLSAPLDELFSKDEDESCRRESEKAEEEKRGKIERIIDSQKKATERLDKKRSEDKEKADAIYRFYGLVEDILEGIRRAKDSGLPWSEIKQRITGEPTPEAEAIVEIKEHEGTVVVELSGNVIELDFTKNVEENASSYYEGSKEARRKYDGAQEAIEQKMIEMEKVSGEPIEEKPTLKKKPRKRWYEKFRWFISSKRFLLVAGKDAATNEKLIKKHLDKTDMVFHTDIQGSAFVVVKTKVPKGTKFTGLNEGDRIPLEVKKEASEVAAACSKAWSKGLGNIDVYGVSPDQVSKSPPSGTSLPKGSFMIYGEREWFRDVEVKMGIGVLVDRKMQKAEAIAGPVMALRTYAKYFVTVKPGDVPSSELAKEIKNRLSYKASPEDRPFIDQIGIDSFQNAIPGATGQLVG